MLKLLLVEDHTILRKGLKEILEKKVSVETIDEANDGKEAFEKILRNDYTVVLMDIDMPGRDGLETLKAIKKIKPQLPIIILSMFPENQYAIRSFRAGAAGYLHKTSPPHILVNAIETAAAGRKFISETIAEQMAFQLEDKTPDKPHESLSDREYQIMCLLASGKTVKEIAGELSLSVPSISTYRRRALEKMKMKNNAELTRYALQHQLVV